MIFMNRNLEKKMESKFIFKNDGIGFNGELLGPFTNTVIIFEPYKTIIKRSKKKDTVCDKVGDLIDIPKYTSNLIHILESNDSGIFSYLSLDYKKKNKLTLSLYSDFTLTDSKVPLVYRKDKIGEYDIYDSTEKIYMDCIYTLMLAKERKGQIQDERREYKKNKRILTFFKGRHSENRSFTGF